MGKALELAGFRPDTLALFFCYLFPLDLGGAKCHVIHQKKLLVASILDMQLQVAFFDRPREARGQNQETPKKGPQGTDLAPC